MGWVRPVSESMLVEPAGRPPRWTTRTEWFDWVVLTIAVCLSVGTVWTMSALIPDVWDLLVMAAAWCAAGGLWLLTVGVRTNDRIARMAIVALAVLAGSAIVSFAPFWLLWAFGPGAVLVVAAIAVALLGVAIIRQRPIRLVWLAAPAIVIVTLAMLTWDLPVRWRFLAAEPALTAYVADLPVNMPAPSEFEDPLRIGNVPIYEVVRELGQVRLVTGYVGILGDDPAGLIYRPDGEPVGVGVWEHLEGPWYRWYPY